MEVLLSNGNDKTGYQALYAASQQLRSSWQGANVTILGFVIVLVAATWTLLGRTNANTPPGVSNDMVAAAVSSVVVSIWRLVYHRITHATASLYGDMVFCEGSMGLPTGSGACAQVVRKVFKGANLTDEFTTLTPIQRKKAADQLFEEKRLGFGGSLILDTLCLAAIVVMVVTAIVTRDPLLQRVLSWNNLFAFWIPVVVALALLGIGALTGQKKARKSHLRDALKCASLP